ncbi:MAG: hypothetical protein ACYDDE_00305 [bacterium]
MKNKNINKITTAQNNYFRYLISNIQCLVLNDFLNKNSLIKKIDNYMGDIKTIDNSVKNTLVLLIKKSQKQEKAYTKLFNYFIKIENGILYIRDTDWGNSKYKKTKSYKKF